MKRITVTPQAQQFFGVVEIPKEDVSLELGKLFRDIEASLPMKQGKGFRPKKPTREEAESAIGLSQMYGSFWRNTFIQTINKKVQPNAFVCYADVIEAFDRGPHYELSGIFFYVPNIQIAQPFATEIKEQGPEWLKKKTMTESNLQKIVSAVKDKHTKRRLVCGGHPVRMYDILKVEINSEVNKGFGGKPQIAIWDVNPNVLTRDMLEAVVGKQEGHTMIVPFPQEWGTGSGKVRATVKILEHHEREPIAVEEILKIEGLASEKELEDRERGNLERDLEKNKEMYFFQMTKQFFRISPIPAALVFMVVQQRINTLMENLGEREFHRRYGRDMDMASNRMQVQVKNDLEQQFVSYGLCRLMDLVPLEDDVDRFIEFYKTVKSEDMRIIAFLTLCKEAAMKKICDIEPSQRSLIILPGAKEIITPNQMTSPRKGSLRPVY